MDPGFAQAHPLRILMAEDNNVNQLVASKLLGRLGYVLDVVGNGSEAVDAVQRQDYDIVLMDVQMPEMNGLDATRAIRGLDGDESLIYIAALSAGVMRDEQEVAFEAGMNEFLAKPLRIHELVGTLERAHEHTKALGKSIKRLKASRFFVRESDP
jgi:CheY-like chemotaxis protein